MFRIYFFFILFASPLVFGQNPIENSIPKDSLQRYLELKKRDAQLADSLKIQKDKINALAMELYLHKLDQDSIQEKIQKLRAENIMLKTVMQNYNHLIDSLNAVNYALAKNLNLVKQQDFYPIDRNILGENLISLLAQNKFDIKKTIILNLFLICDTIDKKVTHIDLEINGVPMTPRKKMYKQTKKYIQSLGKINTINSETKLNEEYLIITLNNQSQYPIFYDFRKYQAQNIVSP